MEGKISSLVLLFHTFAESGFRESVLSQHAYKGSTLRRTPQPLSDPPAPSSSYRDSLKDAQSRVLGSTSFRRRDLSSSSSGLLSPTSYLSLEKRGPKTKPKPQCPVPTSGPPPLASPHTPRERHTVGPPARPAAAPAAGPPLLGRVCGRKRLSVQQKKRSYSEPDSLHEVGVSDPETSALFRRGGTAGIIY